MTKDSRPS
jgi:hypothetical protein